MSQQERVFVIGHRNPDTDSVCSAVGYAELCRLQGRQGVEPARAGHLNRQTEFVFESLGVSPPVLLSDVFPRVRDALSGSPAVIDAEAPLMQALEIMRRRDIRMLPVVGEDDQPLGALILKRLPEHIFLPRHGERIRQVMTSPRSIQTCLQARAVYLENDEQTEELELFVGAMSEGSFGKHLAGTDPRRVVVMTGDRRDIHRDAIAMGIRLLVVTGGYSVDEDLLSEARRQRVSVLSSPLDTASCALLARMSTPVRLLADNDMPRAFPDDRLDELRRILMRSSAPGALVLDESGRICGVVTKSNLLRPTSLKLILVDHNELGQAVPGADQVEILEIIDHHRLGNFHTEAPIRFINQPLGSTCSVVATLFLQAGFKPEKETAALMLAGILSDTVLLRSPTTTDADRELLTWLGRCAGIDPLDFGRQMFQAGSALSAHTETEKILTADFKEYEIDGCRFGVGQVEVVTFQEFEDRLEELSEGLSALAVKLGLQVAALLVTDIVQQNSQLLACGEREMVARIGYPRLAPGRFELKGVLSRKKQLLPHLLRTFRAD